MLDTREVNHDLLTEIENRDNIFDEVDFRMYQMVNKYPDVSDEISVID